ncbi:hypothetical protein Trydic_g6266 [Trypoxylus dichotomus]
MWDIESWPQHAALRELYCKTAASVGANSKRSLRDLSTEKDATAHLRKTLMLLSAVNTHVWRKIRRAYGKYALHFRWSKRKENGEKIHAGIQKGCGNYE